MDENKIDQMKYLFWGVKEIKLNKVKGGFTYVSVRYFDSLKMREDSEYTRDRDTY